MTDKQPHVSDIKRKAPRYEIIVRELNGPGNGGHGHPREVRFVTEDFKMSEEAHVDKTMVVGERTILERGVTAFSITGFTVKHRMNESDYIDRLEAVLVKAQWPLHRHVMDLPVSGRCHYPDDPRGPLIELNVANARNALQTLAHEIGHAFSWIERPGYLELSESRREGLAWSRGWDALKQVGADALISHDEWLEFANDG